MNEARPATRSICLLRLSALGDVCHAVALLRALQDQLPEAHITWIVGRAESKLLAGIDGVELCVFDKRHTLFALAGLRRRLPPHGFDTLLVTQRSLRANLLARMIPARLRIGYDKARSRELHGLAINTRIAPAHPRQHVIDCLLSFLEPMGLLPPAQPRWDFPRSAADEEFARGHVPDGCEALIVSPASSHAARNWRAEHYAAVADHAVRHHGMKVLLCGGPGTGERTLGDAIVRAMREPAEDLIGRDTLAQFLALAARSRLLLGPDSGPAHLANAVGTPVLGLYAATDCRRSGPYHSRDLCIDEFPAAALALTGRPPETLPWGKHLHAPGVMDRITPDRVIARLDEILAGRRAQAGAPARVARSHDV